MWSRRKCLKLLSGLTAGGLLSAASRFRNASAAATRSAADAAAAVPPHSNRPDSNKPPIPVIYTTDLFHPPDFLDDQFDLATLFALPELDIRAVVLEQGYRQHSKPGETPLKQMMALTGKSVPYAIGLAHPLRYPEDKALDTHPLFQKGVELILRALRESVDKVVFIVVGSVRDTAAAFNRDEQLFREKVARIYLNVGNIPGGDLEWNAELDPQAYLRLMRSDLPIYWCPCLGAEGRYELMAEGKLAVQQYQTHWMFRQGEMFGYLPPRLQNYFYYATGREDPSSEDLIAYLARIPDKELIEGDRNRPREMFSTPSLIHAAGRQIYRKNGSWAALAVPEPAPVFDFVPAMVTIDRDLTTPVKLTEEKSNLRVFYVRDLNNYEEAVRTAARRLLAKMPLV